MLTVMKIGLAVWCALAAVAGEPLFDLGDDEGGGTADRIVMVSSVDDLALQGVSGPGAKEVGAVVGQVLKQNPDATRVRVLYGAGTEGSTRHTYVYPRSVTPLDSQNRPHGVEWLATQISINYDNLSNHRLVPWKNGTRDGVAREFSDGKLAAEIPWRDGRMHGTRRVYFPDGKVKSETQYVDGLAEKRAVIWDGSGKLMSECTMKAGKRHGAMTEYWPGTDQIQRTASYKNDRLDGVVREFYRNGKLKRERRFRDDKAHGEDRIFGEGGNVTNERYWFDGDPVSKEAFKNRSAAMKR